MLLLYSLFILSQFKKEKKKKFIKNLLPTSPHNQKYILVNKADGNVVSGNMTYGELKEAYRKILKKVNGKEGVK